MGKEEQSMEVSVALLQDQHKNMSKDFHQHVVEDKQAFEKINDKLDKLTAKVLIGIGILMAAQHFIFK